MAVFLEKYDNDEDMSRDGDGGVNYPSVIVDVPGVSANDTSTSVYHQQKYNPLCKVWTHREMKSRQRAHGHSHTYENLKPRSSL